MAAPLLHTPREAAQILRCTESWLKDQARLRRVPFSRISGAYRFSDAHLNWIVEHFEVEVQPQQPRAAAPRRRTTVTVPAPAGATRLTARQPRRFRTAS